MKPNGARAPFHNLLPSPYGIPLLENDGFIPAGINGCDNLIICRIDFVRNIKGDIIMDKLNKILYLVIVFFLGGLGIHKFLSGRIVPGVVQLVLSFIGIGFLLALVEFIADIFILKSDKNGEIKIPGGCLDFL